MLAWRVFILPGWPQQISSILQGAGHLERTQTTIIMLFFRNRFLLTAISAFALIQLIVAHPFP